MVSGAEGKIIQGERASMRKPFVKEFFTDEYSGNDTTSW